MAWGFNPSSNKYTDQLFGLLSEFALADYKAKQEEKLRKEEAKRSQDILDFLRQRGQGIGGLMEQSQNIPVITENQADPRTQQGGMMSLLEGGIGDVYGRKIQQQEMQPQIPVEQPAVRNRISPFVPRETYNIDPMTGKISINLSEVANPEYESPASQRAAKNQSLANSTRIRQEFINRPEVKDYITIKTQVDSMNSLLNKALSGDMNNAVALDQSLISMYNKLTDPQSVVRESEYARTPENLPIINIMQGAIQKIEQGGAGLTNEDRKALVIGAKIIANERGKTYQGTLDEYKALSYEYGIPENLITRGIKAHKDYDVSVSNFIQPKKTDGYLQTQSGNRFKRIK